MCVVDIIQILVVYIKTYLAMNVLNLVYISGKYLTL